MKWLMANMEQIENGRDEMVNGKCETDGKWQRLNGK